MQPAAGSDTLTLLLQYGVFLLAAILLIISTRASATRDREKAERAEAHVRELNAFIRNDLLPKQVEATILHRQVADVLGDAVRLISELKDVDRHRRSS